MKKHVRQASGPFVLSLILSLSFVACPLPDASAGDDAGLAGDAGVGGDAALSGDAAVQDSAQSGDAGTAQDAATGTDATLPQGVELNTAWIGGACGEASDCADVSDALCLDDGFPGGSCSTPCEIFCPDAVGGYGDGTGMTVSRCVDDANGDGFCVAGCDFDQSPTGCRPGYACTRRPRDGRPDEIVEVCLPDTGTGWPGEAAPQSDVGDACEGDSDCAYYDCVAGLPGGYCSKAMCNLSGCPDGSTCYRIGSGSDYMCIQDCSDSSECREDEGYVCDADDTCWTDGNQQPSGNWDPTVGEAACADAWNAGLSPCDDVPDSYLVVSKSARNLALCNGGALVNNFHIGISPPPDDVGDKVREGDGKTPEGVFYVANLVPNSSFYKAFLISYPDAQDAERGLSAGLIDQAQHDAIVNAQSNCEIPPQTTDMGSYVEVHGNFPGYDWTLGCVSVSDADMDVLWASMGLHDTMVIKP